MFAPMTTDNGQLCRLLDQLKADAAHNASVMERCAERELALLTADGLTSLLLRLTVGLQKSFNLRDVRLALLDPYQVVRDLLSSLGVTPQEVPGLRLLKGVDEVPYDQVTAASPVLGLWDQQRHGWLTRKGARSVAILPLRRSDGLVGFLSLASTDPKRFTVDHATDFLARLANIAAVCLENAVNRERLRLTGLTDALTGLFNRRYLNQRLHEETARALRHREPLSCLFLDVDHFKRVNDSYGHGAGDRTLYEFSRYLLAQLRASDIATRYGGEEFAIILPNTDKHNACHLAERIRLGIGTHPIELDTGERIRITVSIGISDLQPGGAGTSVPSAAKCLLERADAAVYGAKSSGRDRVVHADDIAATTSRSMPSRSDGQGLKGVDEVLLKGP